MYMSRRIQTLSLVCPCTLYIAQCIYMYNVHVHVSEECVHHTFTGREKEMSLFIEELKHVSEHTHRDPGVIVILGSGGLGKTKLLRAMKARAAETGFRVVSGVGGLVEQSTPFFTVKTLIARLLELDTCKNIHDREQLILEHILDENTRQLLPLLNDILVLKVHVYMYNVHVHVHVHAPMYMCILFFCRSFLRHQLLYTCIMRRGPKSCTNSSMGSFMR